MENSESPMFPLDTSSENRIHEGYGKKFIGLTKREYFAGLAMQGLLASMRGFAATTDFVSHLNNTAIKYADELLKQLEPK